MSSAAAAAAAAAPAAQNQVTTSLPHRPICRNRTRIPPFFNLRPSPSLLSQSRRHAMPLWSASVPSSSSSRWRAGVYSSGGGVDGSLPRRDPVQLSLDSILLVAEVVCLAPPAVLSIGCLVGSVLPGGPKLFQVPLGSRVFVWQILLLASAVAIGGLIRRRLWQRVCRASSNGSGVDLIGRIEKVEEDIRSSATIIRVLSRQLEKLGIRFRVTRKALKEPMSESAALARKNSEATRALAVQEDILEKELGEIQKVLLAMQEQQQKQLELILAIGKAGRLLESKRDAVAGQVPIGSSGSIPEKKSATPLEIQRGSHAGSNDRA